MKMPIPIIQLHRPERFHPLVIITLVAASGFVSFAIIAVIYNLCK